MKPTRLDHSLCAFTSLALIGAGSFLIARNDVRFATLDEVIGNGRATIEECAQFAAGSKTGGEEKAVVNKEAVAAQ